MSTTYEALVAWGVLYEDPSQDDQDRLSEVDLSNDPVSLYVEDDDTWLLAVDDSIQSVESFQPLTFPQQKPKWATILKEVLDDFGLPPKEGLWYLGVRTY